MPENSEQGDNLPKKLAPQDDSAPKAPLRLTRLQGVLSLLIGFTIFLFALQLRFAGLDSWAINPDSSLDLEQIKTGFASLFDVSARTINSPYSPLGFTFLWTSVEVFGLNPFGACFPSALSSSLIAVCIALLGFQMGSRSAGLIGALLWTLSPFSVYWAHEARWWATQPLFCLLIAMTFLLWERRGSKWALALHGLTCVVAYHVHPLCGLVSSALWCGVVLTALIEHRGKAWKSKPLLQLTGVHTLAGILFIPWLLQLGEFERDTFLTPSYGATEVWREILRLLNAESQIVMFTVLPLVITGLGAVFFFNVRLGVLTVFLAIVAPFMIAEINEFSHESFRARHFNFALPFVHLAVGFAIAAAAQMASGAKVFRDKPWPRAVVQSAVILVLIIPLGLTTLRTHHTLVAEMIQGRSWLKRGLEEIRDRAGDETAVILVDGASLGWGTQRLFNVFDDDFRGPRWEQMFPATVYMNLSPSPAHLAHEWDDMLWLVSIPRDLIPSRLQVLSEVGTEVSLCEPVPPTGTFQEFSSLLVELDRAIDDHQRSVAPRHATGFPDTLDAYLAWHGGEHTRARAMSLKAAEDHPANPDAHIAAAMMHQGVNWQLAAQHMRTAHEIAPSRRGLDDLAEGFENAGTYQSHLSASIDHQRTGDWQRSLEAAQAALAMAPNEGTVHGLIATAAEHLNRDQLATEHWILGVCLIQGENAPPLWQEAERFLQRHGTTLVDAMQSGGATASQRHRLAEWYQTNGRSREAQEARDSLRNQP